GEINLPLNEDYNHRPAQMVDFENGKESVTIYEVLERDYKNNLTRIRFLPITGRTHQLRVHSAHMLGLGIPIVGDTLYGGIPSERLMLHAESVSFKHPVTHKDICIRKEAGSKKI
ncbi:MAG: RNA pseudouridine synthase, partial [Bacteroidales bacterium]|nr:RNA pseudouridine synthase [Bacteroidales bacterium]